MKNVTRNKFLLCFRPVVDMDSLVLDPEGGSRRSSHSLKYIASGNGPSISDNECSKASENSMMVRRPSKRTFSHVFKAILFETILAKRVRDRKSLRQDSFPSRRSFSSRKSLDSVDNKSVKRVSVDHTDIPEIKSNPDVLSSQSSVRSSSPFFSTSSISESKRHQERVVKPTTKSHTGSSSSFKYCCISLLLMSLAVTILWGRICAILFTSIWLYFLPQERTCRLENVKRLSETESRVYKKRIIMEGLLERNHHREGAGALNF